MALGSFGRSVIFWLWVLCAPVLWGQPDNDDFRNALPLVGAELEFPVWFGDSTLEEGEPNHLPENWVAQAPGGPEQLESVWFSWTAPFSGVVEMGFPFFPSMHVPALYTGEKLGELTPVVRSGGGAHTFSVVGGTQYYVALASTHRLWDFILESPFHLKLSPPPANNSFSFATEVSGHAASRIVGGSLEAGEPDHAADGSASFWWKWNSPGKGTGNFYISWADFPAGKWFLYEGESLEGLALLKSVAATNLNSGEPLFFSSEAGKIYYLAWVGDLGERVNTVYLNAEFEAIWLSSPFSGLLAEPGTPIPVKFEGVLGGQTNRQLQLRVDNAEGTEWFRWFSPFPTEFEYLDGHPGAVTFQLFYPGETKTIVTESLTVQVRHYDDFADARLVTGKRFGPEEVTLFGSSIEPDEPPLPPDAAYSVWLKWIAPEDGLLRDISFYKDAEIFEGTELANLRKVPQEALEVSGTTLPAYAVTGGSTYYLRFASVEPKIYWLDLSFELVPPPDFTRPANDDFEAAIDFTELEEVPLANLFRATVEPGENLGGEGKSVWYQFRAIEEGVLTASVTWPGYIHGVYTGNSLADVVPVLGRSGDSLKVEFGSRYFFQIGQSAVSPEYSQFRFHFAAAPVEDRFEDRVPLELNEEHLIRFAGAWWEEGEPGIGQASLWYVIQPPENGHIWFSGGGNASLWTGESLETLAPASLEVMGGTEYVVRVAGNVGQPMETAGTPFTVAFFPLNIPGDEYESAVRMTGPQETVVMPLFGLTQGENDPPVEWWAGNLLQLKDTMWWKWTAPEDGTVSIWAESPSPIWISAGEGANLEEMQWAAGGQSSVRFQTERGVDYTIFAGAERDRDYLVELSMTFHTLRILSPAEGAVLMMDEPVTVTLSEPVAGYDPEVERFEVWVQNLKDDPFEFIPLPPGDSIYKTMPTNLPPGNYTIHAFALTVGGARITLGEKAIVIRDPGLWHDAMAHPKELAGREIHYTMSEAERLNATREMGEPIYEHLAFAGDNGTLWFRWVAPADGLASASSAPYWGTDGVFYKQDAEDGLVEAPRVGDLPPSFQIEAGTEYLIQLYSGGQDWQLRLSTFEVIGPVDEGSYPGGEPVTFAVETTEAVEDVEAFSFYWNGLHVGDVSEPLWELTTTNLPAGYGEVWAVLTTRSGEVVTNRPGTMLRVFPGNTSFGSALPLEADAEAITFQSFIPPSQNGGVLEGPALYFRYRPAEDELIYLTRAELKAFFGSIPLEPFAFQGEMPIYRLIGGVEYALQVSLPEAESVSIGRITAIPPANDDFAQAKVLPEHLEWEGGGSVQERVEVPLLVTREDGEPGDQAGVWYAWRAGADGVLVTYGTMTRVFRGISLEELEEVQPLGPGVYSVQAGVDYRVGVYPPQTLHVAGLRMELLEGRVAEDSFMAAPLIDDAVENWVVVFPTYEPLEPLHSPERKQGSVWWKWVAPADGRVTSQGADANYWPNPLALFLYEGSGLDELNEVEPQDSSMTQRRWWEVTGGTTYYLAYEDFYPAFGNLANVEEFGFGLRFFEQPANDAFAAREVLSGERVTIRGHGLMATREFGEPLHGGRYGGRSVWYEWQAPKDGIATVRTWPDRWFASGTGLLGVYVGEAVQELVSVAAGTADSGTNVVSFEAAAGEVYVLAVDSAYVPEDFTLELELAPLPLVVEMGGAGEEGILLRVRGATGEAVIEASVDLEVWEEWGTVAAGVEEVLVPYGEGEGRLFLRMRVENDQ